MTIIIVTVSAHCNVVERDRCSRWAVGYTRPSDCRRQTLRPKGFGTATARVRSGGVLVGLGGDFSAFEDDEGGADADGEVGDADGDGSLQGHGGASSGGNGLEDATGEPGLPGLPG
jgi:hypothetical protein